MTYFSVFQFTFSLIDLNLNKLNQNELRLLTLVSMTNDMKNDQKRCSFLNHIVQNKN